MKKEKEKGKEKAIDENGKKDESKDLHLEKRIFLAKKAMLPQIEGIFDKIINLRKTSDKIADKFDVGGDFLAEWWLDQLPIKAFAEDEASED